MTLTISKFTKWRTSDGIEHASKEMAEHWLILDTIKKRYLETGYGGDAADVINFIESNSELVRSLLDAVDEMKKAHEL